MLASALQTFNNSTMKLAGGLTSTSSCIFFKYSTRICPPEVHKMKFVVACFTVPSGDTADSAGEQSGSAADAGPAGESAPAGQTQSAGPTQQPPAQQQVSVLSIEDMQVGTGRTLENGCTTPPNIWHCVSKNSSKIP